MMLLAKAKRCFTLIEVVSAIFLLGILTTFVSFKVVGVIQHHKEKEKLSFFYNQLTQVIETARLKGIEKTVSIDNFGPDLHIICSSLKKPIILLGAHTQEPIHFYITEEGHIDSILSFNLKLNQTQYRCDIDTSKFPAAHIYIDTANLGFKS
ncbi:MAG: type II secretion system protein [Rhabdochlamydiaceae bacterium]|nr:type II secretion system protein [Candidatus Amphrikana amoebophyrae]